MKNVVNVARSVLDVGIDRGAIKTNPFAGLSLPRPEHQEMLFLSPADLNRLAAAMRGQYALLVLFAGYSGLRANEITALRVGRLDLLRGSVDVAESFSGVHGRLELGPTKTYQRRTVGLPRFLCDRLARHLAANGASDDPSAYVFTDTAGGPLRHSNFYRREFRPAVTAAGLPEALRFHDLRHTCVALLVAQGAHPLAIKERLGHSSIAITMDRYGHLFPSLDAALTEGLEDTFRSAESAFLGTERGPQVLDLAAARSRNAR